MPRAITLFTGQWADLSLATLAEKAAEWGYDGLELACWGDHLDVDRAAEDPAYVEGIQKTLADHDLQVWAISNHLAGQLVCDPDDDARSDGFAPKSCAGDAEKKRAWAIAAMKKTARAARNLGVDVVNGFTGSPIWHLVYSFPPVTEKCLADGFARFAELWHPILDVFAENKVKFALEVHPTEIAFDILTAERALAAIGRRPEFGFNFDPSHLLWQGMDPERMIYRFPDRIFHVHMKDVALNLDGTAGILGSHLNFGAHGRGWEFRSLGRGDVDFEAILRALNHIRYEGPLSVEWEDAGMDREHGAEEACEFVQNLDFPPSDRLFDEAFGN